MKRKSKPGQVPVVQREILENAKRSATPDMLKRGAKCSVCGTEVAPNSSEGLCWVCRRLKISAWRDSESQSAIQE